MTIARRVVNAVAALACALGAVAVASAQPSSPPIRIGSTLALTGPLASTGIVHQLVGDIYVADLNTRGGLLGRRVDWIVKDDQSKPDLARTLYEQLITVDKVDLLMGPYATGAILSAMGVAQRYNKMLIHHTFGIPSLAKYEAQFPTWSLGPDPGTSFPNTVLDMLAATPKPPKTIAIVTSKFPSVHFMSLGAREVAKKRGLSEVLFLEWEFGNRDYGPIAARIKDAKPDFVWVGAIGLEGNQLLEAMKKIDYTPPYHFYMYPAPGPMVQAPEGKNALAGTIFEEHKPYLDNPGAAEFVKAFNIAAAKAGLPYTRRRDAGCGVVHRVAGARSRSQGHQEPRRQGAHRLAAQEQGRHDPGQVALRRPEQLRRRPDARQAGAERQVGRCVAQGLRGAGRLAGHALSLTSSSTALAKPPSFPRRRARVRGNDVAWSMHQR